MWAWAGQLRQRETNIGLDPHQVPVRTDYLTALRHADNTADFTPLIESARRTN